MKTTLWTGTLLVVALLMAGCGKAQPERPAPAPAAPQVDVETPALPRPAADRAAEGAQVAEKNQQSAPVETKEAEESTANRPAAAADQAPAEKPTVLKAVGRALFKAIAPDAN
jgi:hypothetical protein